MYKNGNPIDKFFRKIISKIIFIVTSLVIAIIYFINIFLIYNVTSLIVFQNKPRDKTHSCLQKKYYQVNHFKVQPLLHSTNRALNILNIDQSTIFCLCWNFILVDKGSMKVDQEKIWKYKIFDLTSESETTIFVNSFNIIIKFSDLCHFILYNINTLAPNFLLP